jgi:hypothetical protein
MKKVTYAEIGKTTASVMMKIFGVNDKSIVNLKLKEMEKVWLTSLSLAMK